MTVTVLITVALHSWTGGLMKHGGTQPLGGFKVFREGLLGSMRLNPHP